MLSPVGFSVLLWIPPSTSSLSGPSSPSSSVSLLLVPLIRRRYPGCLSAQSPTRSRPASTPLVNPLHWRASRGVPPGRGLCGCIAVCVCVCVLGHMHTHTHTYTGTHSYRLCALLFLGVGILLVWVIVLCGFCLCVSVYYTGREISSENIAFWSANTQWYYMVQLLIVQLSSVRSENISVKTKK